MQQLPQIPNPLDYRGFTLWQESNRYEKDVNIALKPFGLNQAEMFHLISIMWLTHIQGEITQTDLAKFTGVTTMSVSKIIRKLESCKFIQRSAGRDMRSNHIKITELGISRLIETADILHNINNALL